MERRITYRINYQKAVEAIVFLARKKPGMDIYHVAKVLFYADKLHVNRYGFPIIGDSYICMPFGPAPSAVLDLIKGTGRRIPEEFCAEMKDSVSISPRNEHYKVFALREPNLEFFSKNNLLCLEESILQNADKSFDQLVSETHQDPCWTESDRNAPISMDKLIDESNPLRSEIIESMLETSAYAVL